MLFNSLSRSSLSISTSSSAHPISLLLSCMSSSSASVSWSICCSSSSRPANNSHNSLSSLEYIFCADSSDSFVGSLNCLRRDFAMRLIIWVKHQVHLSVDQSESAFASSFIIVSLLDALLQVMLLNIYYKVSTKSV